MRKILFGIFAFAFAFVFVVTTADAAKETKCTTIQSGELLASDNTVIETGFDEWGYNYQGNMFNGKYCDAYRDAAWCQAYKDDNLSMKWNDAWLSNQDCDGDGLLDRHNGYDSYIGSGAWLTNHMSGIADGKKWTYFVKIVAKPNDSFDCSEVNGQEIWGAFCTIQEVNGRSGGGGISLHSTPSGFGFWQP